MANSSEEVLTGSLQVSNGTELFNTSIINAINGTLNIFQGNPELESGHGWKEIATIASKAVVMGLIILVSIMGNALVIVSILMNRKLQELTSYFLVSLATADICVAVCAMTFNASVELSGRWMFGYVICDLWNSFDVYFSTVSILNLCCISMDRYYAVLKPLKYPLKMTKKTVYLMLALVWSTPVLISFLPIFFGWYATAEHLEFRSAQPNVCTFEVNIVYSILSSLFSFWIPCTVMIVVNYKILQEARKQETAILSRANSTSTIHNIHRSISRSLNINNILSSISKRKRRKKKDEHSTQRDFSCRQEYPLCNLSVITSSEQRARAPSIYSTASEIHAHCESSQRGSPCRCSYSGTFSQCPTYSQTDSRLEVPSPSSPVSSLQITFAHRKTMTLSPSHDRILKQNNIDNGYIGTSPSIVSSLIPSSARASTSHAPLMPSNQQCSSVPTMKREHKAAKTLGTIMGAFIVCWCPFFTWYVVVNICGENCPSPAALVTTLFWIGYFNSTLNPFIYAYFRADFREAFKKTLRKLKCTSDKRYYSSARA